MKGLVRLLSTVFVCFSVFGGCHKGNYKSLSVEGFQTLLRNQEVQLVDVRTNIEYSESHIPEAININVLDSSFGDLADTLLQKNVPIAVYCRTGNRSKKAAAILSKKGYKVYELDYGFNAWKDAGKEIEK